MPTHQIDKGRWTDFLEAFSAHNQTRNIKVDMEHNELGPQTVVESKPLLAMETDLKDEKEPAIIIIAGDPEGGEPAALTHRILEPTAIWVKEDDQGHVETLDIESDEGRTLVKLM